MGEDTIQRLGSLTIGQLHFEIWGDAGERVASYLDSSGSRHLLDPEDPPSTPGILFLMLACGLRPAHEED